jgi:hypothetical protein
MLVEPVRRSMLVLGLLAAVFLIGAGCGSDSGSNPEPTGTWEVVGTEGLSTGDATDVVLCVDAGTPYVAFIDEGVGGEVVVKKYDGDSWVQLGDSVSPINRTWIAMFVSQGVPYVTYDWSQALVKKYVNNQWVSVGGPASSGIAIRVSIFVAGGVVYLAYGDGDAGYKLTVKKFVDPDWTTLGTEGISEDECDIVSIQVDGDTPYVAFRDWAYPGYATVMKYDGAWTSLGGAGILPGEPGTRGISVNTVPYVMYSELDSGKANVVRFAGGSWQSVGAADFSPGGAWYGSLVINAGVPFVAFQDEANGRKATVMELRGGGWQAVGDPHFTASGVQFTSLQIWDSTPCVAFRDMTTKKATVMRWVPE